MNLINNLKISFLGADKKMKEDLFYFLENWFSIQEEMKVQTSGSTGIPKILQIEKSKMRNSAEMTCRFLGLHRGDTALLCLPMQYISGKMMVVRALQWDMKLYVAEPNLKPLEKLDFPISFCAMTPLQVENSLDKIHLINNLIIGGAMVSEHLKSKIKEKLLLHKGNQRVFETYGMSETLSHIALKSVYPVQEEYFSLLNGVQISTDDRGCLSVYAPKLNSELLQTNDIIEIKNESQFRFIARVDNVINTGGAKVFPEELENLVNRTLANEVAFIGVPDEILGQRLILVVEGEKTEILAEKIMQIPFEKKFHRPKEILFVEKIPRTPNNKIDRLALRKQILG